MWSFNTDTSRWEGRDDRVSIDNFNFLKAELSDLRFYSKCLSGATYIPITSFDDIYDVLGDWSPKTPYINNPLSSQYSNSLVPSESPSIISRTQSDDYYVKSLSEYGLTLKNLFTPDKIIKDSISNFYEVDVATTESIDFSNIPQNLQIDDLRLVDGHKVLVKNNQSFVTLSNAINPQDYFTSEWTIVQNFGSTTEYSFYNEENGVYTFRGGSLIRDNLFDDYDKCLRTSFVVKSGLLNTGRQYHLVRLLSGFFPVNGEPMKFVEKKNWILRNRVDYNNLFEINYYDVKKFSASTYQYLGVTYSIPERIIAVGEFGTILNTQSGISNLIDNKYKVNLRSIAETDQWYWICGDSGVLLRVRKHDFVVEKIDVDCLCPSGKVITSLKSIDFFNDRRGVVVGELNTILITGDSGLTWNRLRLRDFDSYYYNRVIYTDLDKFYIGGNSGIFLEFFQTITGWNVNKLRVSKKIDDDDEYLLLDHIRDIRQFTTTSWNPTFSFTTQSTSNPKDLIILTADYNKIFIYDKNSSIPNFDFISLDLSGFDYGDINSITPVFASSSFLFSGTNPDTGNPAILSFNLEDFTPIGVGNSFSNTVVGPSASVVLDGVSINNIFQTEDKFFICGNESLLESSTASFAFATLDDSFEGKLKSKLLYLDYDVASKLNFFTDGGNYRLPNSVTFSSASFSSTGELSFSPIIISATAPSFLTQSQLGWIDYWSDRQKTFQYYSTTSPMTDSTSVILSTTFSWTNLATSWQVPVSAISSSASSILQLAPSILDHGHSRFSGLGLTAISAPLNLFDIYIFDYLLVFRENSGTIAVGDVLRLESSTVDSNLIVNRVETLGGNTYHWMFTDFNSNMVRDIASGTSSVTIRNLNKYSTPSEFTQRFRLHPLHFAYSAVEDSGVIEINPLFNNLTSYYNLSTRVELSGDSREMSYTDGFLKFGYQPNYNLLDYLESINEIGNPNPAFYADRELFAMPQYLGMPLGSLTSSVVYIDTNGLTYSAPAKSGNTLYFGVDLEFEWRSLFINTYVDVNIYGSSVYSGEKLLIVDKWFDSANQAYVIEFHKNIIDDPNFIGDANVLSSGSIDILSRRKLGQISSDLQDLNLITRQSRRKTYNAGGTQSQWIVDYQTWEPELNWKPNTDSYAKILLSEPDFVQSLSGVIYTDYKNELALNITRLGEEFSIPITNTANFIVGTNSYLYISCSEKHNLVTSQGVVLEFNGGTGSSQQINQQYFGYHNVTVVNDFNFYVDIPYGNIPLVGNDTGLVKFTKRDPFLNYQPIDLIDLGVDGRGKISIELNVENLNLSGRVYRLVDVDLTKYRFRLIDGLNIEIISTTYPWLLEAEISGAVIGSDTNGIVWYTGTWECGRWFGGTWISGTWLSGDWYSGTWNSLRIKDSWLTVEVDSNSTNLESSTWFGGRWFDGVWNNGTWIDGRWYGGSWNQGVWYRGIWNDGTWNGGLFTGGIWVLGTWNAGRFNTDNEPAFWIDGKWYSGDFENGIWYNGLFENRFGDARFGVNAFNSRTATWNAGIWVGGDFHSRLNTNSQNLPDVSTTHKFSIWKTGRWISGNFWGGVAYNMDFKSGTWHGGILEDIQVIGLTGSLVNSENKFTLNGEFKFNIGDEITLIDNGVGNLNSQFGSNDIPRKYKVLKVVEDSTNKWTDVWVDAVINASVVAPNNTGLRVVSRFSNLNWKSGIWTNGIYESGLWEGGIWYDGVFSGNWM